MAAEDTTTKLCRMCGLLKARTEFGRLTSSKDGLASRCRECDRAFHVSWRKAAPEKSRAKQLRHYYRHRVRLLAKQAERRQADGERIRAHERALYARNRERICARKRISARRRWALYKDRIKLYQRAYYRANSAIYKQARDRYMSRRKSAPGRYTQADVQAILQAQKHRCAYCRCKVGANHVVDHIVPLNKGGTNHPRNLQITCSACNSKKRDKDPLDFARQTGRLI